MNTEIQKHSPRVVAVRSLVEFVMTSGDISSGGFQRRDRAQLGTLGHRRVQRSRPEGYRPEVAISLLVEEADPPMLLSGRIDGLYDGQDPVILEEIKTTTLSLDLIHEDHNPLHWGQAQCYAFMLAHERDLESVTIRLTYYHLDSRQEKTFDRKYSYAELSIFFQDLIVPYLKWFKKNSEWLFQRDRSIEALGFPYSEYRPGQREMAVAVFRAVRERERLYIQSPTGVGKTIAALFPSVKALAQGLAAKIFYLTAKTPGRVVAEKALDDLRRAGLQLRSVTLTAKEKICFCPPVNCDPEICSFARGYYDKVRGALGEFDHHQSLTRSVIEEIARRHEVCPFELSLDLALWADCIICDYNYAFDPRVYLHRFFDIVTEPYVFLIDEAHNLPDRARAMYSAEIRKRSVLDLQREIKPHLPSLGKKLGVINKILLSIRKSCQAEVREALVEHELREDLLKAVADFSQMAENWLAMNELAAFREDLLDLYFQCSAYLRTADSFDSFYVSYFELVEQSDVRAKLFCLDPAPMLAGPLERSVAAIFFSATLLPMHYFKKLLTGSFDHSSRIFQSPFPVENTCLLIHDRISTKFEKRADTYTAVAEAIETVCDAREGNYLVFFPSHVYMNAVFEILKDRISSDRIVVQDRAMTETDRENFLARFEVGAAPLIGFAVMGGIFGEGIDLVGERLIGVVVVGVGVPQMGLERDLIREYFDGQDGSGFAFAYQLPGFNRVLQAAGRVVRTETDRGVIVLVDERFLHSRYRELFPAHWRGYQVVQNTAQTRQKLKRFWSRWEQDRK